MFWALIWQVPLAIVVYGAVYLLVEWGLWRLVRWALRPAEGFSCLGFRGTSQALCSEMRGGYLSHCPDKALCAGRARRWRETVAVATKVLFVVLLIWTIDGLMH